MKVSTRKLALGALVLLLAVCGAPGALRAETWQPWTEVPGGALTTKSASAVWFKREKLLYMFHVGNDNRVYYQTTFKTFVSGWSEVPGNMGTYQSVSPVIFNNILYLFMFDGTGQLRVNTKPAFGAWGSWITFVDLGVLGPPRRDLTAISYFNPSSIPPPGGRNSPCSSSLRTALLQRSSGPATPTIGISGKASIRIDTP